VPNKPTDRVATRDSFVEQHTIEVIPQAERHGRPFSLFTIWFNASLGPLTLVTGALATQVFGLNFWWALIAMLFGNLVGGVLMALHSAQGPKLGVAQMIQSRGQFGMQGSLLVVLLVLIMYLGFFASNLVTGAESLQGVWPSVPGSVATLILAVVGLVVTVVGYDLIHRAAAWMTYAFGTLTVVIIAAIFVKGLPSTFFHVGAFNWAGFVGMITVCVLWQIAYAPYVSDYSRYMPATTAGMRSTFWWTYAGTVLSTVLQMLTGVMVALMSKPGSDVIGGLNGILGSTLGKITLLSFFLGTAVSNSMNLYGAILTVVTAVHSFVAKWLPRPRMRVVLAVVLGGVSTVIALALGGGNFLVNWSNFIAVLQYVLVPWTAINLIDFYLVRRGDYDVKSFFRADGGIYGRWNWTALSVYAAGFLVEIPFMATTLYTGPIAARLHDTDISWIVSLVVTVPLYTVVARLAARRGRSGYGSVARLGADNLRTEPQEIA